MAERKRIFVGGLFPGVTEQDLTDRFEKFGKIKSIEIKNRKDDSGGMNKTFAYIDGDFVDVNLQKCFNVYNKNTWKGHTLKLQLAKESFLEKLKRERECRDEKPEEYSDFQKLPEQVPCKRKVKGAVPGTPIEGEKNWVVGKYGVVLPVVYLRRKDKKKIMKLDPSKYCHNVKRMKEASNETNQVDNLTWELEEQESDIIKKRKGNFPEYKPKKKVKPVIMTTTKTPDRVETLVQDSFTNKNGDDFEVVKIQPGPKPLSVREKMLRIAGMVDEKPIESDCHSDSDGTDEIISSYRNRSQLGNSYADQTSNSICAMTNESKALVLSENVDSRLKRQKVKQEQEDRHDSDAEEKRQTMKRKSFPFKGTKLLNDDSSVIKGSEKSNISRGSSGSDVFDKVPSKVLRENEQVPAQMIDSYRSSSESDDFDDPGFMRKVNPEVGPNQLCTSKNESIIKKRPEDAFSKKAKTALSLSFPACMDEFSTGLISFGDDYMLPYRYETSSSDSDYDSEDYDKLAAKKPRSAVHITSTPRLLDNRSGSKISVQGSELNSRDEYRSSDESLTSLMKNKTKKQKCDSLDTALKAEANSKGRSMPLSFVDKSYKGNKVDIPCSSTKPQLHSGSALSGSYTSSDQSEVSDASDNQSTGINSDSESFENYSDESGEDLNCKKDLNFNKTQRTGLEQCAVKTTGAKSPDKSDVMSKNSAEDKHKDDNQKRLLSLRQRQKEAQSQKSLIQQALKLVDSGSQSNRKIVFSTDSEEDTLLEIDNEMKEKKVPEDKNILKTTNPKEKREKKENPPLELFQSSSEESADSGDGMSDTEMFELKPQFEGHAGKKLMYLQSRIGNDPRFKLDHRFTTNEGNKDGNESEQTEEKTEKTKMMQILSDVVGQRIPLEMESAKNLFKGAVRYDPTKEDHGQFELKLPQKRNLKNVDLDDARSGKKRKESDVPEEKLPEVGQEKFFEVSSSLKDAFNQNEENVSGGGFSLLSTFGKVEIGPTTAKPEYATESKPTLPLDQQIKNFFSSDVVDSGNTEDTNSRNNITSTAPHKLGCFFFKDDQRLEEGFKYSCRDKDWVTIQKEWQETRQYYVESYRSIHKRVTRRIKAAKYRKQKQAGSHKH